jgi:hypothetical protein
MVTQDPVSRVRFGYINAIGPHPLLYFCNTNRQRKVTSVCFIWRVRSRSCSVHLLPFPCLSAGMSSLENSSTDMFMKSDTAGFH